MKRRKAGTARPKWNSRKVAVKRVRPARAALKAEISASSDLQQELAEARERLTATSDILRAIAASPPDAEGSLRNIAETSARLFGAVGVSFRIAEGDVFKLSVGVGQGAEQVGTDLYADPAKRPTVRGRNLPGTVIRENRQIHLSDLDHLDAEFADWPGPPVARRAGIRTMVGTPLRTGGRAIGALIVYRNVLQPFEPAELQLLQSFADQAVIAIENARLFEAEQQRTHELTELLEQQTATSDVLRVISSSPGDLDPVFTSMLENAVRICGAAFGIIYRIEGGAPRVAATINVPPAFANARRAASPTHGSKTITGRMLATKSVVHVADGAELEAYTKDREPSVVAAIELGGVRTVLAVPLLKDNELIGSFALYRQEVLPFTDKQIALVTSFASQAVIAIENARLLTELRELLAQQTATSEVLQVISSTPGDLPPVFASMLENAVRICGATFGTIYRADSDGLQVVATHNMPSALAEHRHSPQYHPGAPGTPLGDVLATKTVVHVANMAEHTRRTPNAAFRPLFPVSRSAVCGLGSAYPC